MKEDLISFDTAKLAKEAGFPQDILGMSWYNKDGKISNLSLGTDIKAPTQSLLQKWLREIYNIYICIDQDFTIDEEKSKHLNKNDAFYYHQAIRKHSGKYFVIIRDIDYNAHAIYNTYEDGLEFALLESLKHIIQKKLDSDR